jgi:hypothetical protein
VGKFGFFVFVPCGFDFTAHISRAAQGCAATPNGRAVTPLSHLRKENFEITSINDWGCRMTRTKQARSTLSRTIASNITDVLTEKHLDEIWLLLQLKGRWKGRISALRSYLDRSESADTQEFPIPLLESVAEILDVPASELIRGDDDASQPPNDSRQPLYRVIDLLSDCDEEIEHYVRAVKELESFSSRGFCFNELSVRAVPESIWNVHFDLVARSSPPSVSQAHRHDIAEKVDRIRTALKSGPASSQYEFWNIVPVDRFRRLLRNIDAGQRRILHQGLREKGEEGLRLLLVDMKEVPIDSSRRPPAKTLASEYADLAQFEAVGLIGDAKQLLVLRPTTHLIVWGVHAPPSTYASRLEGIKTEAIHQLRGRHLNEVEHFDTSAATAKRLEDEFAACP